MAALTTKPAVTTRTTVEPRATVERRSLRGSERRVVRALGEAMFSEDGEVSPARLDVLVDEVDAHVSAASRALSLGMRVLLFLVRISPILIFFRLRTIEKLSVGERVQVLSRLERSKLAGLSLAWVGWRTVTTLVFYEDPVELDALGYTVHERARYKRALPVVASAPPIPAESGVRLKDLDADDDHEHDHEHLDQPRVA